MCCSHTLKIQVKEVGQKETGKARCFSMLFVGLIKEDFKIEEKECKD